MQYIPVSILASFRIDRINRRIIAQATKYRTIKGFELDLNHGRNLVVAIG